MNRNLIRIVGGSNRRTNRGRKTGIPGESRLSGLCDCIVSIILFQADYTQIGSDCIDIIGIQTEFVRNSYEKTAVSSVSQADCTHPIILGSRRLYSRPDPDGEDSEQIGQNDGAPTIAEERTPGCSEASDDVRMRF